MLVRPSLHFRGTENSELAITKNTMRTREALHHDMRHLISPFYTPYSCSSTIPLAYMCSYDAISHIRFIPGTGDNGNTGLARRLALAGLGILKRLRIITPL